MKEKQKRTSFKRWHPYLGEWVIMAPTTAVRPWSGNVVSSAEEKKPEYDPSCYLCPGVERAGGVKNPDYCDVYVFNNDFPSLTLESEAPDNEYAISVQEAAKGMCRVVCFSPRHNLTLAEMDENGIYAVLSAFRDQFEELSAMDVIENVIMFENKGAIIGVSNPHPHGQIYASDFVPRILKTEYTNASHYMNELDACLFCNVLAEELKSGERIVCENEHFFAFVPFFARHSFEVHIMPRRHVSAITGLDFAEMHSLAAIYREMLIRYDNLFEMSFPNITLFRNPPCANGIDPHPWHFYIEFCPPLRSRDKLKYMAGFETGGGNIINPILPKEAAEALRSLPTRHYKQRTN